MIVQNTAHKIFVESDWKRSVAARTRVYSVAARTCVYSRTRDSLRNMYGRKKTTPPHHKFSSVQATKKTYSKKEMRVLISNDEALVTNQLSRRLSNA